MVPVGIPIIIRHLIFRVPKKELLFFDSHPYANRASLNESLGLPPCTASESFGLEAEGVAKTCSSLRMT